MNTVAERLAEYGLTDALAVYEANKGKDNLPYEERVITDMVGKLAFYGALSDKQYAFMGRLLKAIPERAERDALRKAEAEAAKPLPEFTGRVRIEGTVLTVKYQDTRYGTVRKMLLKHADGWKVWGTVPAYAAVNKGDRIALVATVERSKDDEKFGFFARPKNFEMIEAAETETDKEAA